MGLERLGWAVAVRLGAVAGALALVNLACGQKTEPGSGPPRGGAPKPTPLLPNLLGIPANNFRERVSYFKRPNTPRELPDPKTLVHTDRLLGFLMGNAQQAGGGLLRHTSIACRENDTLDYFTTLVRGLPFPSPDRLKVEPDDLVARSKAAKDFCDPDHRMPFQANNLHIEIQGNDPKAPSYLFSFHADCHPSHTPPAEPELKEGRIHSTSGEPLCADDLAGAAQALEAATVALEHPDQIRFSKIVINAEVAEEIGVKGAKKLDPRYMGADMVFVLDGKELELVGGGGDIHFANVHIAGEQASRAAAAIIAGAGIGVRGLLKDNPRTVLNIDEVRSEGRNPASVGSNFNSVAPYAEIRMRQGVVTTNQPAPPGIQFAVAPEGRLKIFGKTEHPSRAADAANACVAGAKFMIGLPQDTKAEFWCGTEGKGGQDKKPFGTDRVLTWQLRNLDVATTGQYVADFERRARKICDTYYLKCSFGGLGRVVKGFSIDRNGALANVAQDGFIAAGLPAPEIKDDFGGSAANEFAARGGIDAVVWPTGAHEEHTPGEYLVLDEFYRSTQALVGAMLVLSQYQRD